MIYKRTSEPPKKHIPKCDHLYCEDAQIEAIRELIGGLSEKELYAVAQQLREMGVFL